MFAPPPSCGSILAIPARVVAHVDGSSRMRPGKMSRRFRRRVTVVAILLAAIGGAVAVGTGLGLATEITWGYPAAGHSVVED